MTTLPLDGEWQLFYFPEASPELRHPDDLAKSGLTPIPAQVPGNVELDLQRAGLLPDPFYANNIQTMRRFETYEWWYTRRFTLPESLRGQRCQLVCAGLDTLATVWLNGVRLGDSANMLVEQRFEAGQALRPGENTITVRLGSVLNAARRYAYEPGEMSWEHRAEGLFIRKAPHVWGWDILPRAVSAGIWRSLWLETVPETAIEQVYYWTADLQLGAATLGAWFQLRTNEPDLEGLVLRFAGVCWEHKFAFEWPVEFNVDHCLIPVEGAQLWWPAGYGDPHLYTLTAQLCRGGQVLAERVDRIGIRKIGLEPSEVAGPGRGPEPAGERIARQDQPPDPDSHFRFTVNGEPILVKGTNWVALDAFHSRAADRLEPALALARDLGCNMIRCWGGNVYESDRFYELCDETGILVWQDFAFACCRYPQTEAFLARVREEAEAVVRRLRNHPSLAVWCGDNEVDMVYVAEGLDPRHNRLTRQVIPQVIQRCDPQRAYLPSSPYVSPAAMQRGRLDALGATPEQHLWGPRGYFKSPFYSQHSAHFIGEIGYHGCPSADSIRKFVSPEAVWPWQDNAEWQAHSVYHWKDRAIERDRIQLMANQVREFFGSIPAELESFALASQITQAEALKFFIESTRLRKWRTSGILWWNLLDGWPQFSDAVVDYYFEKKLAYAYIWRVQRPVCVIIGEAGSGKYLPVVVCNDSRAPAQVHYRLWEADSGETVAQGACSVPANQNWQVEHIRAYASDRRLYLIEWEANGVPYGNHYLAAHPPVDLERYRAWLFQIARLPRAFDYPG